MLHLIGDTGIGSMLNACKASSETAMRASTGRNYSTPHRANQKKRPPTGKCQLDAAFRSLWTHSAQITCMTGPRMSEPDESRSVVSEDLALA